MGEQTLLDIWINGVCVVAIRSAEGFADIDFECLLVHDRATDTNDRKILGEIVALGEVIEGRNELDLGEVACNAKNN